ncbi:DUF4124 domain-containing protein [Vibrio alfacsensis]|nr:DUF4124 domain-containing protein [Vibrio alfacsensis]WQE76326.1 DUF4124 domain-containing protein [Vibrio alfacsensis]
MSAKMRLSFAIILISSSTTAPCTQKIFTWLDEKGVRHFSDTPQKGAEVTVLPNVKVNTSTPALNHRASFALNELPEHTQQKPLSLKMLKPQHDMAIRSNQGIITVQLKSNRPLESTEQVQLLLDGKPYDAPQHNLDWRLNNIDRGTHTLAVQTIRNGKLIASTIPITVHLHRASVSPSN